MRQLKHSYEQMLVSGLRTVRLTANVIIKFKNGLLRGDLNVHTRGAAEHVSTNNTFTYEPVGDIPTWVEAFNLLQTKLCNEGTKLRIHLLHKHSSLISDDYLALENVCRGCKSVSRMRRHQKGGWDGEETLGTLAPLAEFIGQLSNLKLVIAEFEILPATYNLRCDAP